MQHLLLSKSGAQLPLNKFLKVRTIISRPAAASSQFTHSCSCSGFDFFSQCICMSGVEKKKDLQGRSDRCRRSSGSSSVFFRCVMRISTKFFFAEIFMLFDIFFCDSISKARRTFLPSAFLVGVFWRKVVLVSIFCFLLVPCFARLTLARVFCYHIFKATNFGPGSAASWGSPVASWRMVGEADMKQRQWVGGERREREHTADESIAQSNITRTRAGRNCAEY